MVVYENSNYELTQDFNVGALLNTDSNVLNLFAKDFVMSDVDMYNTLQAPSKTVNESIGDTFNLTGVIVHPVTVVSENTGDVIPCPRIILVGSKGESYVSVSMTLFSSLKNLFAIMRTPDQWGKDGIPVKLRQSAKGEKRYFSIEVVKTK